MKIIKLLLNENVDMNKSDQNQINIAFIHAAKNGHDETVELLLNKEADIDARDQCGKTALMRSVEYGRFETAKFLLNRNADLNLRDKDDNTALILSAYNGYDDIMELLLKHEKNIDVSRGNKDNDTFLSHYFNHCIIKNMKPNRKILILTINKIGFEHIDSYLAEDKKSTAILKKNPEIKESWNKAIEFFKSKQRIKDYVIMEQNSEQEISDDAFAR